MAKGKGRQAKHLKNINLALQGGGSHGAFTWGVLDRLFEEDLLWVEAISGTSAGAMNAVVATQGMYDGGAKGAQEALKEFWWQVSKTGQASPIQRSPLDVWLGNWSLENSPGYLAMDMLSRVASPYDLNPFKINPLRNLVEAFVDFDKVRDATDMGIFISATNVETGRVRVFTREEITLDVVMASACLPHLFQAVEIDGVPYWDGGFMGNPVLFPFIDHSPSEDILIIQINPITRKGIPKSAREIQDRVSEITFNASLLKELRSIDFICRMVAQGKLSTDDYRPMKLHMIAGDKELNDLGASTKSNSEWAFLQHLHGLGVQAAERWLTCNFEHIGERSTIELGRMFRDTGVTHKG